MSTALIACAIVGASAASSSAAGEVYLSDSTRFFKVEPKAAKFVYYGNSFKLTKMKRWRGWGTSKAKSSAGVFSINGDAGIDDKPGETQKATLVLSHPGTCYGTPVYKKAVIVGKNFEFEVDGDPSSKIAMHLTCDGVIRNW